MTFYSRLNRPVAVVPPIGDGTAPIYEEIFENGHSRLKKTGSENLFEFVQSSKEETLVYNIIARYRRGDVNALNQRAGQYLDVVGMPTNLAEAYSVMQDVQRKFDSLAPEVRKNFSNDVNVFIDVVTHSKPDELISYFGVTKNDVAKEVNNNVSE